MKKISIIVPVYNTEKYLAKCLDSIINQTYKNIEIIIVNDASTDHSEEIINDYLNKYPNLINYYCIEHSGVANARNYGISRITGDYFLFVDSDDYINSNLLLSLNQYIISNSGIDIIKYKMQLVSENTIEKIPGPVFSVTTGENAFNMLCFEDILIDTPCLYLIRTNFFKSNNFKFLENTYREDFGLMPLLMVTAEKFMSVDLYGYNYFKSDNSIMRNSDYNKKLKQASDLFLHYNNMIKYLEHNNLSVTTINNLKQYYTNGILLTIKTLKRSDRNIFISNFRKMHLASNIKPKNFKQFLKRCILSLNINLYFKF